MESPIQRWLILDIYLPSIFAAIARGSLITAIPLYLIASGFSASQVGLGTAAIAIGNLLSDIPAGILVRKLGERRLMLLSLFITSLATLLIFLKPELIMSLAIIYGIGRSLWLFSRRYVISYYLDYSIRGRASSFIGASERIGTFIGPSLTAIILSFAGYEEVFLMCFIITLLASFVNLASGNIKLEIKEEAIKEEFRLKYTSLFTLASIQFLIQGVRSSRTILFSFIGKYILSLKDSDIAFATAASGLLDVLGSYPSGLIMDKKGRHVSAKISFSIMALGFFILALSYDQFSFFFASIIIGLGNGFSSGLLITIGGDISNRMGISKGSQFLALWQFIGDSGAAVSPSFIGIASELIGSSPLAYLVSVVSLTIAFSANYSFRDLLKTNSQN